MNSPFKVRRNVSLADKTTLKIGGATRFFVEAETESEVVEALRFAEEKRLEVFVLGGGSNVLIADEGFDGLVLQIALKGVSFLSVNEGIVRVTAQAGEDWDRFVETCVERNLAGVECLSGIPGWVGGTPVQNVGAYGQEVSETILSVRVFDRKAKKTIDLLTSDCGFAYRRSIFNSTEKNRFVVLAVTFALQPGGKPKILYKDLQEYFAGTEPTLSETRRAVLEIRRAKSMVIDENDPNSRSAGSFFKNPIVSSAEFQRIGERAKSYGIDSVPFFASDEGMMKIPAAWLIEKSGFHKGFQKGRAGLSKRHTLALVNIGGALAKEVLALKTEIQDEVENRFGVRLETEPIFLGFKE